MVCGGPPCHGFRAEAVILGREAGMEGPGISALGLAVHTKQIT